MMITLTKYNVKSKFLINTIKVKIDHINFVKNLKYY